MKVQKRQIELQQQQLDVIEKGFERLMQCISENASAFMQKSLSSAQSACGLLLLSTSDNVVAKDGSLSRVSAPMITVTVLRPDNTKTDVLVSLVSDLFNLLGRET